MQRLKTNANHLQIVRHDRTMEQIVFPVPNICEFLTRESKYRVFNTTERDEQGSKVNDFFQQTEDLYNEMKWQKKIRSEWEMQRPPASLFTSRLAHCLPVQRLCNSSGLESVSSVAVWSAAQWA